MTKRKILLLAMSLCMVAIMVAGGTLAYLTDSDFNQNVMTVGDVDITQTEDFPNKDLYPGSELLKKVTVTNVGTRPAYIRTIIAFEDTWDATAPTRIESIKNSQDDKAIRYHHNTAYANEDLIFPYAGDDYLQIMIKEADGTMIVDDEKWTVYTVGYTTYADRVFQPEESDYYLNGIYLNKDANNDWSALVGSEYKVQVLSQAVQTENFKNAADAWTNSFGTITNESDEMVAKWFAEAMGLTYGVDIKVFDYSDYNWLQMPAWDNEGVNVTGNGLVITPAN